jgi:alpha-L-fucosidase
MNIMDFANDDNFRSSWSSNPTVKEPWYELTFDKAEACNMIVITSGNASAVTYSLQYYANGRWNAIKADNEGANKVSIFRFERIWCEKIKVNINAGQGSVALAEVGVFNERN